MLNLLLAKESDPTRTNDEAWQFIVCLYYPPGDPEGFDYDKYPWTSNVGSLVSGTLNDIVK